MYAVLTSGGKQYRVEPGATLVVERLAADAGSTVTFDRILLLADGEDIRVGTPTLEGVTVSGTVLAAERGPKIIVFKFKQKVKYRRRTGHRQQLTRVRIDAINAGGKKTKSADAKAEATRATASDAESADPKDGQAGAAKAPPRRSRAGVGSRRKPSPKATASGEE